MKKMNARQGTAVLAEFDKLVKESLLVLVPAADDYNLARDYLGKLSTGLRGGDALHLAIAANRGASKILTSGRRAVKRGKTTQAAGEQGYQRVEMNNKGRIAIRPYERQKHVRPTRRTSPSQHSFEGI